MDIVQNNMLLIKIKEKKSNTSTGKSWPHLQKAHQIATPDQQSPSEEPVDAESDRHFQPTNHPLHSQPPW